jgi:hypothetical protein
MNELLAVIYFSYLAEYKEKASEEQDPTQE